MFTKKNQQNPTNSDRSLLLEGLIGYANTDIKTLLSSFDSSEQGLANTAIENNRKKYGSNVVAHEHADAWYLQLVTAFINPFTGVLFFLGFVSLFTDIIFSAPEDRSYKTITVLSIMITISAVLRFWQEFRSGKAAEKLKAMVHTTTAVLRNGNKRAVEIPIHELVPGDIICLSAGDMIPADLRLISCKDLFISQAVLTGESMPVEKHDHLNDQNNNHSSSSNPIESPLLCFMGTNVVSGSANALVVATGNHTYFGSMARNIVGKRVLTSFDKGINRVSWILIRFMAIMVPVVFLINGFDKGDWLQALLFAISVAVGLTPEMLPMIVTTNLARSAVVMSRRKTIVKRLNSIQNFGAMDILCTDKTGTLTQDKIVLQLHLDINGNDDKQVLEYAYLNSFHQTGLRNLLDVAVMEYGSEHQMEHLEKDYKKIDEIPFDFMRRRMSVIVKPENRSENLLICKGAIEEILGLCTKVDENGEKPGGVAQLTSETKEKVLKMTTHLNEEGLRVMAIAYKSLDGSQHNYGVKDENDLILVGYIAFLDPPKESAHAAIAALSASGIKVKIITGDNEIVTKKICRDVNINVDNILLGKQIETMSDDELATAAEDTTIFAKMSPMQKARIVKVLKTRDHTVGYMGDGINDAPALREADVGISVDTAVDIAKESADIILLEKSLMVLQEGVIEGRKTFCNIIKYIKMTASSNFGNVFSVLIASAFLPFLPMIAIQLLVQNLFYDISQISIPWDNVDKEYLEKPRKWEASGIARFMMSIGPISSIFDISTFCLMWFVFGANNVATQSLFQSGWFVEGLLSQTLIVHMIRTNKIPFFQSMPSIPVILLTMTIMAVGIYIPFSSLGAHIGLVPLPSAYFPWLLVTLLGYCVLTQIVKFWYIRRFKQWL